MHKILNSLDYFITKDGDVYKENKKLNCNNHDGYRRVSITYENGSAQRHYVHRLVAEAFVPNPENKPFVNHIDGNKSNNSSNNLEWVTNQENIIHAKESNLLCVGEDKSDLYTDNQIHKVCKLLEQGMRVKDVAKATDVSSKTVSMIKTGKQWTHISKDYKISRLRGVLSEETIRWVCYRLQEGLKQTEIVKLASNSLVTYSRVDSIKSRKAYTYISQDFNF